MSGLFVGIVISKTSFINSFVKYEIHFPAQFLREIIKTVDRQGKIPMTQASDATMRYCFALDLKNDPALIARYKDWHRAGAVPQAINRSIRNADIRELEIWHTGDRLFMIMTVGPDFSPEAKALADRNDPEVQAWEQLMWEFQKPLPFAQAGEKWVGMQRIYALNEQP